MENRSSDVAALAAIAVVALAATARAQSADEPYEGAPAPPSPATESWFKGASTAPVSDEAKAAARDLLTTGRQKFDEGDFPLALESFRGAHALVAVPPTGLWLARAQERVGLLLEAAATLQRVQRYPQQANEPAAFADARTRAAELHRDVVAKTPTIAAKVSGQSDAYQVRIDGLAVQAAARALPIPVNPGEHELIVSAPGLPSIRKGVTLGEGEHVVVDFALRPPRSGGAAPKPAPKPRPLSDESADDTPIWATISLCGAGAALAGGVVTGAMSFSRAKELEDVCPDGSCSEDERADYDTMIALANASNVSFAVAGAAAVAGIAGVIVAKTSDEQARLYLTIEGAGVVGTF